jgi:hypothetical protein
MILNSTWFTNMKGSIGIILTQNEIGEKKFYISSVDGFDQEVDERFIAEYGAPVLPEHLIAFLNQ